MLPTRDSAVKKTRGSRGARTGLMERSRMDAEAARAVKPNRRIGKLAVVVAVQNLLVVVCLVVTFFVYRDFQAQVRDFQTQASEDIVHIRFSPVIPTSSNATVQFSHIGSSYLMDLTDKKDQIAIKCTGFYFWHVHVCYTSLSQNGTGTLALQTADRKAPAASFTLDPAHEVCRALHGTIYLKRKQLASVHLSSREGFKIRNMTVGLRYLQGEKCVY